MTKYDWSAMLVGIFGVIFLLIAATYPWISFRFGVERPRAGQRMFSAIIGVALVALWSMWFFLIRDRP
ncbi:MAG: hypothetical protein ACR2QV_16975 [Gammaproteobacteria bacterium]